MRAPERFPDDLEQEKAEIRAILASKLFVRAPSQAKLFSYICQKYFEGEVDQIKEYTIAVELFKREEDFQSKEDPIVRVEANRLRARLKDYYRTEGKERPIRVFIPSGQYAPIFEHRRTGKSHEAAEPGSMDHGGPESSMVEELNSKGGLFPGAEPEGGDSPSQSGLTEAVPLETVAVPRVPRYIYLAALSFAGLALLISSIILLYRYSPRHTPVASTQPPPSADAPLPVSTLPAGPELRIMAGSKVEKYVDRNGRIWMGDRYFRGGEEVAASQTALLRADESHLCRFSRQGDFDYSIPVKNGVYELHLYFVEMQFGNEPEEGGETSRLFNVLVDERPVLELFDVYSDAGGSGRMDERVFTDISPAPDGMIHISFRSFKSKALINGLEVLPGTPGRMLPIRIITRPSSYLSPDQRLWESDRYYSGGRSVTRIHAGADPKEPELYQSERYGNFTYTIPVASGRYRLTLKFAETYFGLGPTNPAGEGPGMRLFDIYCNGQTLLKNFDITKEAGGKNRSLDKVFHGLEPNAQGKLVLSFVPVKNYACVNAIEVAPEPETARKR